MIYEEDSVIIHAYISGNESALETLINRYKTRIYSSIYNKVLNRDVAEDIFQDTFVKVILTLKNGKYNEEGKFYPWVQRIAHNLTIDYFRANKKMPKVSESSSLNEDYNIFDCLGQLDECLETKLIKEQINSEIIDLIDCLPADQKEVLILRIFRDLTFKEIAEETEVSINTALGRMRYALINLRKLINEKDLVLTID
ncbi:MULTISPECIES: RNA polymerase sigma factor [Weeksella]|uniref:RNA polymerase, sigma-24 subunit, ECF subfamily n=1 Tax=Weeksella virosa (strain ATCC 43766 / DSM 16922 / JCM 21250 / CCUG 30538 / CDC 9751 / IAM 14551 / NBRC 16016 / NCTC 11634 / CL345/78) TaxID=865938 RepID=F0NZ12_WEEVC|nr:MULTISPECIES: sigma-70 family RNA polymerase sigma factor [Weeksella]ADX68229.1 RNA polymerase, sigma-24 subunit, ECF subfamily [Weeksella virosa DSM 16922]MDK7374669.1 sigma-70 family RNA polymerase sigma factor [Weeksella virosa]OFM83240.1 RNA polymerase subunit sigma-24 [Weeksella sp. HMSC059D05]SUP54542.1 Sigma-24 [Weeksella virosa]VEH64134.1 Sigma-24 [Weeksella virosa]